ncbi:hypothetical protein [Streptomyces sp. SCSIO ZS0520]|uniref:hypothetical protein n=1 Tax=Streptomyces sp. SCSIO ZS0520 TaxID=2892996 RepID=UPI0021D82331|nr:hypothetical protein [Streptomyces sp. SCSIO ZS0520]
MSAPTRPISDLDVPAAQVSALAILSDAAARSHSPSDRLAYALDAFLVTHPDAPVSTVADYPEWAAALGATETEGGAS